MPDLLKPVAESPADPTPDVPGTPPRTREAIRSEWKALAERLKSLPRDSDEGRRLRARVLELWAEEVDYIPEEEFAENREFLREIDSRRSPDRKLFPDLGAEGEA